ncbi:MAG: WYL domain-containing protein [Bacteroidales bacterium]|nr:WYL domain-containing protein [Bacteroidales bacterium]
MVGELIDKYIWLLETLLNAGPGGLSLEELQERYEDRYDAAYPRRSFNNHRSAILDAFGVEILCDRRTRRYYIPGGDDSLDATSTTRWLVDTFTVGSVLSIGKERLSGRVSVDEVPSGHRHLTTIMKAMLDGREIAIGYEKYTASGAEPLTVRPYALKEVARRWYLIGFCLERNALRVYGLDRIRSLRETGKSFTLPKDFDAEGLFRVSYGVYLPDEGEKPVIIRIKASPKETRYLRDLPIHPTQELEETLPDGSSIFRIFLIPNEDFIMELCRRGPRIEVLSPSSLRSAVADEHKKAAKLYEDI